MKVKIIDGVGSPSLENEINDFIKDKEIVDIKYQSNISGYANEYTNGNDLLERALIIYKEDKND